MMPEMMDVPRHRFTDLNQLPISLRLGSYACEILGWGLLGTRWWRNYLHVHSFFEICYAFEGEGTFRMHDVNYPVQAGDVFVAKPSEPHEIISSQDAPLGIYFWSYTLVPDRVHTTGVDVHDMDRLLQAFSASRCWVSDRTPAMQRTLELLTEEMVNKAPGYRQSIEGLVAKLLLDTARAVTEVVSRDVATLPKRNPSDLIVQRMVQYLRDNYGRPIAIRDLAAQVHLSERHTRRLFHQAMGVSIMDYLTSLRIDMASQLLLDGRASIKQVGQACGLPDVQHFTTVFRRRTGLTPAAFRKRGGTQFLHQAD